MSMNIPDALGPLFDDGLLDEVIRPLMSGKEASVYLVRSRGELCVAKVYKEAQNRSFRQRSAYAEGRQVRNSRQRRAMEKGSKYGKALLEAEWQNSEVQALYRLHQAGVRVPVPYHHADNVLLMELVVDAQGEPGPRLYDLRFMRQEALELHVKLIREVVYMLCAGLVHGDLSEYNILMDANGPVIIDLPQATDAAHNRNSERIFLRDVKNLAMFLGRAAPQLRSTRYGPEIWDLYIRGQLHRDSKLTGRFKRQEHRVDTESIIAEIQASAAEASDRPMSAYQMKKMKKIEEALAARNVEEEHESLREEEPRHEATGRRKRRRNRRRGGPRRRGPDSGSGKGSSP
jgi:RIO kinase 1